MNNTLRISLLLGLLLAVLLAAPAGRAQTMTIWTNTVLTNPTVASTAGSANLTVSGGAWSVGDIIKLTGTAATSNPFSTAATHYYVVSVSGNTLQVATTPGGAARNAVNTTTASPTTQAQDWLTTTNWLGGVAPNSSSTLAVVNNQAGNGGTVINGLVTVYGLINTNNNSGTDLTLISGGNGTGLEPLTFMTTDGTVPELRLENTGNFLIFLGTSSPDNMALNIAGTQGLRIVSMPGGALSGSGTAATCANPAKQIRLNAVSWTSFSGGLQIERGYIQPANAGQFPSPAQALTVGDANTISFNLLAGLNLNGQATSFDALNGNSLGRIWGNTTLTVGAANGSGTYGGVIGRDFPGTTSYATALTKTGTGTETISGLVVGTGAVTVNGSGGTLILSGINTYSGVTTVTAGKLVVSTAQTGTGAFSVANGGDLGVTVAGTSQLQPTTLTLGTSAATTLEFNGLASTTSAPLKPGTLALNGTVTVNINSGTFAAGNSYPLVTWTSLVGTGSFALGTTPLTANLSTIGNTLYLNVTAVTDTWTGNSSGNWDTTTANWTVSGVAGTYADGSTVVFDDTATGVTNLTVAQLVEPGNVTFNNNALAYSAISSPGNYIGGAGSVDLNGTGPVTLTGPNTYSGGTVLGAGQLNVNYGGSSAANSAIGTGPLTLSGGGTIDNTSSGDVTLLPNNVQVWNGGFTYAGSVHNLNFGTGAVTLGASEQINITNNTLTVGGAVGDSGLGYSLTKTGNGTLSLAGGNTFSGGLILSNGTVQAGSSTALGTGASQLYGGTLDLNGQSLINSNNIYNSALILTNTSASAGALAGNSKVNTSFTIAVGPGNISVARLINTGSPLTVTKNGAGTLTFNGAGHNNLMGVIVNAGTAMFANSGGYTADRGVTLNGGTIKLGATGLNSTAPNSDLINDGTAFSINGGVFDLNGWNASVAVVQGTNGVILNNDTGTTATLTIGADNNSATFGGTFENGNGVLALTMNGNGVQTLTGTNTYTGGTIVSNGTLQAGAPNLFPTAGGEVTVTGTLDLNTYTAAINGLNGTGTVDTEAGGTPTLTVGVNGDNGNFSGTLQNSAGTLSLVKTGAGQQTLSGGNYYSGTTTLSNGTLVVASSLNGGGTVTVNAPGVLLATNSPTITGAVVLVGGATFSQLDGAIDTATLNGGLSLSAGNVLQFDIGSGGLDQIAVSGSFTQSGRVTIDINQVTAPNAGTYPLISGAAGISASQFTLGNTLSGYALSLTSDASNLYLVVALNAPASAYWHNYTGTAWNGHTGSTYNWDTDAASGSNAGTLPAASSDVYFAANGASSFATTLGANFVLKSLTFNVANTVTIGGAGTLTLNGPITVNSGAGSDRINAGSLVLGADQTVNVADSGNTLAISSPISGAHALTVSGSGTVALSGVGSFTGGTTITGGTLALNTPVNALPSTGAVTVNGGTLGIGANNETLGAVTLTSGSITGSSGVLTGSSYTMQNGTVSASLGVPAAVTVDGGSVLMSGNSTYTGGTLLSSGTLQLGAGSALGGGAVTITSGSTLDLNGQTIANAITYNGPDTLANNSGTGTDAAVTADASVVGNLTIDTTGGNITVARLISTSVARTVTKTGADTLTLNGAGHNNLITLVVNDGTVLCANRGGFSADRGLTLNSGTLILDGPGNNSTAPNSDLINNTEPFTVNGGIFDVNGWNETVATLGGTGGVIENNATDTNATLTIGADNGTNDFSGTLQNANGVLAITMMGTGIQTLDGTGTYSGNTTLNNGQLLITATAADPNSTYVVNTNGGLQFENDTAFLLGNLAGTSGVDLVNNNGSALSLTVGANNGSTNYSGILSDDGAGATLTKVGSGTLTFSGANT